MKRVALPQDVSGGLDHLREFTLVDWKARPEEVLDEVDDLLKPFGLEVVMPDVAAYGGPDALFTIQRRTK
jgi:hypothetical protein